jgi:hypothetical protein
MMKKTVLLNVCGVGAKCVLNTLIIGANLVALGMLVVRESIDKRL